MLFFSWVFELISLACCIISHKNVGKRENQPKWRHHLKTSQQQQPPAAFASIKLLKRTINIHLVCLSPSVNKLDSLFAHSINGYVSFVYFWKGYSRYSINYTVGACFPMLCSTRSLASHCICNPALITDPFLPWFAQTTAARSVQLTQ